MRYFSGSSSLRHAIFHHFLLAMSACLALLAGAIAREAQAATPVTSPIRSAQLFEQDGRWASVSPRGPDEERAEIGAHFAAVRGILGQDTPVSLAIAAARFEQAYGLSLSPGSRAELVSRLGARRASQLERLLDYARAGRFPLNRHYAGEARPIFVDAQGTHCAVGHLMALDGWEFEVNAIAQATPNVLVREVDNGPLVAWLLTSGLTQEEAALIQPFYSPPPGAMSLTALIVPGVGFEYNGFSYENFTFSGSATGGATTPTADPLRVAYGWPPLAVVPTFCTGYSASCVPRPDTLWFGVAMYGSVSSGAGQSISFDIEYDVVASAAGRAIGGMQTSTSVHYGGIDYFGSLSTTLDSDPLRMLVLNFPPNLGDASASTVFDVPADRLHVRHTVNIADGNDFTAFQSTILQPVPLPGSLGLLACSLAAVIGRRALRTRSTRRPGS